MANFLDKLNDLFTEAKTELVEIFAISLGLFLFVLFFNPFGLNNPDLNNQLLVILGLGGIVFLLMSFFYIVLPYFFPKVLKPEMSVEEPQYIPGLVVWVLSSVAFSFYIRYVGKTGLSFFMVFKTVMVCLVPVVVYWVIQTRMMLKQQIVILTNKVERMQAMLSGQIQDKARQRILIETENKQENMEVLLSEIILVRSADNYVELVYIENNELKKRLLRTTHKNIEKQLTPYPDFIRCHRTTLINASFVEKVARSYSGVMIKIKGFDIKVPVSRQYLLRIKEVTDN